MAQRLNRMRYIWTGRGVPSAFMDDMTYAQSVTRPPGRIDRGFSGFGVGYRYFGAPEEASGEASWWAKMTQYYSDLSSTLEGLGGIIGTFTPVPPYASGLFSIAIGLKTLNLTIIGTKEAEDAVYAIAKRVYPALRSPKVGTLTEDDYLHYLGDLGVVVTGQDIRGTYKIPDWVWGTVSVLEKQKVVDALNEVGKFRAMNPETLGLPKPKSAGFDWGKMAVPLIAVGGLFALSKLGK